MCDKFMDAILLREKAKATRELAADLYEADDATYNAAYKLADALQDKAMKQLKELGFEPHTSGVHDIAPGRDKLAYLYQANRDFEVILSMKEAECLG